MINLSRRSILGGVLSVLCAASTQIIPAPAAALLSNRVPRIFGNGRDYDSEGFQALFDGKDVIIPSDKLQVSKAVGVIFHKGTFVIDREVYTNGHTIMIEHASFDGRLLKHWEAFFSHTGSDTISQIIGNARWQRSEGHMAIDIGNRQYSILNQHIMDQTRFRPKVREEL